MLHGTGVELAGLAAGAFAFGSWLRLGKLLDVFKGWPKPKPEGASQWLAMMTHKRSGIVYVLNCHPSSSYAWGDFGKYTVIHPYGWSAINAGKRLGFAGAEVEFWALKVSELPAEAKARLKLDQD